MGKKGKWEHLRGKIPNTPAGDMTSAAADKSFIQKVDDYKKQLAETIIVGTQASVASSLPELMHRMKECNQEWDKLKEDEKALNVAFEALGQLILKRLEALGVSSVKNDLDGSTFYRHSEPMVGVKEGRKSDAEAWVDSDPDLHYLWSIHPQSLSSWVKEKLDNVQEDQIPEFIRYDLKTSVRVKKA